MATARSIDRKLSRQTDQRRLLVRTLAVQLIEHGKITTTEPRAKVLKPYVEKLTASAIKGGLARRRRAIGQLDVYSANRLFDLIAPQMKRASGFLSSSRAPQRSGDLTPMVTLKFVDEIASELPAKKQPVKAAIKKKPAAKKAPAGKPKPATKTAAKESK